MFSLVPSTAVAVAAVLPGWEWESYEQTMCLPHSPILEVGRCFCWLLKQSLELAIPWILAIKAGWPTERCCRSVWVLLIKIGCLCCEESLSLVLLHTCPCMCSVISHTDSFSYKWAASSVPYSPPSLPQAITSAVTGEPLAVLEWAVCLGLCEQQLPGPMASGHVGGLI